MNYFREIPSVTFRIVSVENDIVRFYYTLHDGAHTTTIGQMRVGEEIEINLDEFKEL